jgi:hypothetical protein
MENIDVIKILKELTEYVNRMEVVNKESKIRICIDQKDLVMQFRENTFLKRLLRMLLQIYHMKSALAN